MRKPIKFAPKLDPLHKQGTFRTYGDEEDSLRVLYVPSAPAVHGRIVLRLYDSGYGLTRNEALELAAGLVKAACCYTEKRVAK